MFLSVSWLSQSLVLNLEVDAKGKRWEIWEIGKIMNLKSLNKIITANK